MAFCSNCGKKLNTGAKFCDECGIPVASNEPKRKKVYDGDIHKCPYCGETLNAFKTICPTCGTELRGIKSSSAISVLAEKLENAKYENQRIVIIKNYPIPNTREDIFEFMLLASSNFDSSYYAAHLYEENISSAWLTKIEQCYSKAKLSFNDHPDFRIIENIYLKIKADSDEKERKVKYEEKAKREELVRIETKKEFEKSRLRNIIIIFTVISVLCATVSFNNGKILAGIIASVMFVLFVVAFLMGSGVIKEKIRYMRVLLVILAFVMFIPYLKTSSLETDNSKTIRWEDIMLNTYAPKPIMTSASVMTNSKEEFYIYDIDCSQRDYYDYVNACKEFGYDYEIIEEDEYSFEAFNEEGYKIRVGYITTLHVEVNSPMEMNQIEWPNSDIAKFIPQPKSLYGKIEWEHDYGFVIYIGNTTLGEYKEYVNSIYTGGFNVDYSKGDTYFWADNLDGYHVIIKYEGFDTMFIRIDEPNEK